MWERMGYSMEKMQYVCPKCGCTQLSLIHIWKKPLFSFPGESFIIEKNVENFGFWTWRQPGPQSFEREDACA